MKKGITTTTTEIKEIMSNIGKPDKALLTGFLRGGNPVLTCGAAKGKECFYGAAVEALVDKEFTKFLPFASSLLVWIGSNGLSPLRDVQWLLAALLRKAGGNCDVSVITTEDMIKYGDEVKVTIVAK